MMFYVVIQKAETSTKCYYYTFLLHIFIYMGLLTYDVSQNQKWAYTPCPHVRKNRKFANPPSPPCQKSCFVVIKFMKLNTPFRKKV